MTTVVLLDAGPLGLVTNPQGGKDADACNRWLQELLKKGYAVRVPEISDYEVRRELVRAKKKGGIERLDRLAEVIGYIPLSTSIMRKAAEYWATARNKGTPTADDKALDVDMILSAQATEINVGENGETIIATTNVGHLSLFADAKNWRDIG